jgi:hypothetical protein
MGAEGMGFFLSDTDEDHRIVHWALSAHLMGTEVFGIPCAQSETEGWLAGWRSSKTSLYRYQVLAWVSFPLGRFP